MAYINGKEILFSPIINIAATVTLNGTFVFNDDAALETCPQTSVNFTSNGGSFTGMYITFEVASYYFNYERAGGYEMVCERSGDNTWTNTQYRIVTFENQKVTGTFYLWLIQNATEKNKTLNGMYIINSLPTNADLIEYGSFLNKGTSAKVQCIKISSGGSYPEIKYTTSQEVAVFTSGAWTAEVWRTFYFDNDKVTEGFYNWITANAVK